MNKIIKYSFCCLIASSFSLSLVSDATSKSNAAMISTFNNKVQAKTKSDPTWKMAGLNKILESGDSVRTGSLSRAEIKYSDGTVTRVGSNSLLRIEAHGEKRTNIKLLVGKLWLKVKKGDGRLEIRTPTAIASVLGTELLVTNDEKNISHVTTLDGLVEVTGENGDKTLVKPGEWVEIAPGKNIEKPTKFDWDALKRNEKFMLDPTFMPKPEEFKDENNWK